MSMLLPHTFILEENSKSHLTTPVINHVAFRQLLDYIAGVYFVINFFFQDQLWGVFFFN